MVTGTTTATESYYRQYSAGTYGDYGRETEIYLTEQQALAERFNDVPLWIRPQSFFQTNPAVASQLYATARDWVRQLPVKHMWDLFCGVGGFGLHCATPDMQLTGIEIASEAIACAKQSAAELGLTRLQFQALDSTQFATAQGRCRSWCWLIRRAAALVNRYVIISQQWHRVLLSTPAVTPKPWRKISANCQVTASNGYSFLICSRTPRTMKC